MESVKVHISAPGGITRKFDAELYENDDVTEIRGEYDIVFDGKVLKVKSRVEPKYEMTFGENLSGKVVISTPYGSAETEYFCRGVKFRRDSSRLRFTIVYKLSGCNYGIYKIDAKLKEK